MAEEKKPGKADWQKNSGRPSNFNEKDEKLKKDREGNLKIEKDKNGVSPEEDKAIRKTLNSLREDSGISEEE